MIDRKIAKFKARRGTEAQRVQVIFEEGEFCYTTDTEKLYIGDGITYGGNPASNKGYIVTSSLSSVPSFASKGDTIFSKESGLTYIVDLSGSSLILRQIGSNFDPNSISAINITNGSVGLSGLNSTVVAISGGIGFTSVSGLFIRYDPLTLTLENGLLKVLPQGSGGTAYQFNTLNGGITIGNNATVSVDVDNTTIGIVNNKLTYVGLSTLNDARYTLRSDFNALTASQYASTTWINFNPLLSYGLNYMPNTFSLSVSAGSNLFTITTSGNTFPASYIGTVFRVVGLSNVLSYTTVFAISAMKITSVSGSNAYGIIYGGNAPSTLNITGTSNLNGVTLIYEPYIRNSKNVKFVKRYSAGDYKIFFENNMSTPHYTASFGVRGAGPGYGRAVCAMVNYSEDPTLSTFRMDLGYQDDNDNSWRASETNYVTVNLTCN